MDRRKDATTRKRRPAVELFALLLLMLVLLSVTWLLSTPLQKKKYLSLLQLHETTYLAERGLWPWFSETVPYAPDDTVKVETNRFPLNRTPTPSVVDPIYSQDAGHHGVGSACTSHGVENPSRAEQKAIYKWVDEDGQNHFSDEKPPQIEAQTIGTLSRWGTEDYSAAYRFLGFEPNAVLQDAFRQEIDTVFRFFENQLKIADLPPVHVNLVAIAGKGRFARYRRKVAPNLTTNSGFYRFGTNEAVIRWRNPTATLPVVRHEITHLLIGNGFGDTPVWFSEGFAEVFERLDADQKALTARLDERAIDALAEKAKAGALPSVRWLMRSSRADWDRNGGQPFFYGYSWALVHYLLSTNSGRNSITQYLRHQSAHRCQPSEGAVDLFSSSYADGLQKLNADFRKWLANKQAKPLYF